MTTDEIIKQANDETIRQAKARNGMRDMSRWLDLNHNTVKTILSQDLETPLDDLDKDILYGCIKTMGMALSWMEKHYNEMEGK